MPTPRNEKTPMQEKAEVWQQLSAKGYTDKEITNALFGQDTPPIGFASDLPEIPEVDSITTKVAQHLKSTENVREGIRQTQGDDAADAYNDVQNAVETAIVEQGTIATHSSAERAHAVRQNWADWHEAMSFATVDKAQDAGSWLKRTAAAIMGNPRVQIGIGVLEPASRPQQALFSLISGKGWEASMARLRPRVIMPDAETGDIEMVDPWTIAIDALWEKHKEDWADLTGRATLKQRADTDRAEARQAESMGQIMTGQSGSPELQARIDEKYPEAGLLTMKDVVEEWIPGENNIDQAYAWLDKGNPSHDKNWQVIPGLNFVAPSAKNMLRGTFFLGDILLDPLVFVPALRKPAASVLKNALTSTGTKARYAAMLATKTNHIDDIADALRFASRAVDQAKATYAADNSIDNAIRLVQANDHLAQQQTLKNMYVYKGAYTPVNFNAVDHVDDVGVMAREVADAVHTGKNAQPIVARRQFTRRELINLRNKELENLHYARQRGTPQAELSAMENQATFWDDLIQKWEAGWRPGLKSIGAVESEGDLLSRAYLQGVDDAALAGSTKGPTGLHFTRGAEAAAVTGAKTATARVNPKANLLRITNAERMDMMQATGADFYVPEQIINSPAFYALSKLGKTGLLEEISKLQKSSAAMPDLEQYPLLRAALGDDLSPLSNPDTLADTMAAKLAREAGFDGIQVDPLERQLMNTLVEFERYKGTATAPMENTVSQALKTQYVALTNNAIENLKGVPFTQRHFYDDIVAVRKALTDDANALDHEIRALSQDLTPANKKMLRQLNTSLEEVRNEQLRADSLLRTIENGDLEHVPHEVRFTGKHIRKRTVEELRELEEQGRIHLRRTPPEEFQPRDIDDMMSQAVESGGDQLDLFNAELAARTVHGPDDVERAADALVRLAGGEDPDNVLMPVVMGDQYNALTSGRTILGVGPDRMIQLGRVNARIDQWAKKLEDAARIEHPGYTKPDGTYVPPKEFKFKQPTLYDDAKKLVKDGMEFDESWLPSAPPTAGELLENGWPGIHRALHVDRLGRGLYPGTWMVKPPALLKPIFNSFREGMRGVQGVDRGKSWELLHNASRNTVADHERRLSRFLYQLERFGAVTMNEPNPVSKALITDLKGTPILNDEMGIKFMDIMEMPRTSDEFKMAMSELSEVQRAAVNEIREELDLVTKQFGFFGTKDMFIEGYMPHVFDATELENGAFPTILRGTHENANIFMRYLLPRSGQTGYVKDPLALLDLYSRAASNKLILEPAMHDFLKRATYISKQKGNGWYADYARGVVGQLKGTPSTAGQWADNVAANWAANNSLPWKLDKPGRTLMGITGSVYASLLAGNRRYPFMALATNFVTTAAEYGIFRTVRGFAMNMTPEGQALFRASGGDKMWQEIFEVTQLNKIGRVASRGRLGTPSIQDTENFIRGITFHAAIGQSLDKLGYKTLEEAGKAGLLNKVVYDAVRATQEVNHFFGPMGKPPMFTRASRSGAALATQFKSFGPKQTEQLLAMTMKDPGKFGDYLMYSGWLQRVAADELGINMSEYLGLGYVPNDSRELGTSPGLKFLVGLVDVTAKVGDLVAASGDPVAAQESVDEFIKSTEKLVPMYGFVKSMGQSAELMGGETTETPGRNNRRDVSMDYFTFGSQRFPKPGGPKGERNEFFAGLTGLESMVAKETREARNAIFTEKQQYNYDTMKIFRAGMVAVHDDNWDKAFKLIDELASRNIPVPDLREHLVTKKYFEEMNWVYVQYMQEPALRARIDEIINQYPRVRQ